MLGKLSGFRIKRITNCLEQKLKIDFRHGGERNGWYYLENRQILRVTVPKGHGGSDLSPFVAGKVKNQLRLDNIEFRNLYNCPMSGADYREKVKGLISQGLL